MHPHDVAQHLAHSVRELRDAVAAQADSVVEDVSLNGTELRVQFAAAALRSEVVPSGLVVAVAPGVMQQRSMNIPILGTRRRETSILALGCDDWDTQPPTATLLLADGTPLPTERWPRDPKGEGIVIGHPDFGPRPFFCRPGLREFHTHPQHEDEPWDRYREGMTLAGIVLGVVRDLSDRWTLR